MKSYWFLLALNLITARAVSAQAAWSASLQGSGAVSYMHQNTLRRAERVRAIGWTMAELTRTSGGGSVGLSAMLSLDPITLGACGYPRLAAGAGLCQDAPFEDRSHAHPLIMDLSASLSRQLNGTQFSIRGGLAGQPALGPTSYMHRASASADPIAPLTHHDLNPAHVANGYVTAGATRNAATLEVSAFNSEAGDDDAYDLDLAPLHAWSSRLTWRFSAGTRAQVSAARLEAAQHGAHSGHESTDPNEKLRVLTASIETTRMIGTAMIDGTIGISRHHFGGIDTHAVLLETSLRRGRHALLMRAESLERTEQDVQFGPVNPVDGEHEHIVTNLNTRVSEFAGVYTISVAERRGYQATIGIRGALTLIPEFRRAYYGEKIARALAVTLQIQPARGHAH